MIGPNSDGGGQMVADSATTGTVPAPTRLRRDGPGGIPGTWEPHVWLACGVVAGPVYVVVSLAQALTRDGFDLSRHSWSLLSNGDLGWLQISNFIVVGVLTIAFAVGLRRVWSPG